LTSLNNVYQNGEDAVEKTSIKKQGKILVFLTGFIRIKGVVNWSAISFFGFLLGISSLNFFSYILPFLFFVVSTFFILAFTFAINNYNDIDTDKENPRRVDVNAMASGKISKQTGMLLNIIFVVIPLVLSLLYKLEVFVFCAFLIFWMWAYSAPPLRLKGRPGADILWHCIAFVSLVLWGSYIAGSITVINGLVALSVGIFGCIAQIDNHIRDYSFDKASGSKTFVVWAGMSHAKTIFILFIIIHTVFLFPLIMLYCVQSVITILVLCGGTILGLFVVRIKKGSFVSSLYRFIIVFGASVYVGCLIYHINYLLSVVG
jgi:4-hydroxybenzoate polyprenyltransferase